MPFLGSWGPFVPAVESTGLTLKTGTAARFRKLPHQRGRKHFSVLSGQCAMPETVEVESRTSGSVELVDARDGEASSSAHLFYGVVLDEILADNGALAVLGQGMGSVKIAALICDRLTRPARDQAAQVADAEASSGNGPAAPPGDHALGAVLVLGAYEWQRDLLLGEMARIGSPLQEITGEVQATDRTRLYASPMALLVTYRILVVDLLRQVFDPSKLCGVVVLNAHRIDADTGEGYCVRLCRQQGSYRGPVVGLTEDAAALASGFSKAEKVLKGLHVRRLLVWPRFRAEVKESLGARAPEVVEVQQDLTECQKAVQGAIGDIVERFLKELRRFNKIDATELTLKRGLLKSFDEIVRGQLNPIWHTVPRRTKMIVADLATLRNLAVGLLRYDCVTFLRYLESLRAADGAASLWLFDDAAFAVFDQAKRRVYHLAPRKAAGGGAGGQETAEVIPVLEEPPKWNALRVVMEEIQAERAVAAAQGADPGAVLVVAQDWHACGQLRAALRPGGGRALLEELFASYLASHVRAPKAKKGRAKRGRGGGGGGGGAADVDIRGMLMAGEVPGEREALLATAARFSRQRKARQRADLAGQLGKGRKRRGAAGAGQAGEDGESGAGSKRRRAGGDGGGEGGPRARVGKKAPEPAEALAEEASIAGEADVPAPLLDGVTFYAIESRSFDVLWDISPSYVVFCEPDLAFIRQLEIFCAERTAPRALRVYHLTHPEGSLEAQRYLGAVEREKGAMERLIRSKERMVAPVDARGEQIILGQHSVEQAYQEGALVEVLGAARANAVTRQAGGRGLAVPRGAPAPKYVVVDTREFVSALPGVLHQAGLVPVPVTLEVGDYVLSPEIVVERKALPDLFASLNSGRLYAQATAMCREYKTPVLLIEFDAGSAFALQSPDDLGSEIDPTSICSKLSLLCLHHPQLRLLWSRSMHHTAAMFRDLKANQEEPDATAAAKVGVAAEQDEEDGQGGAETFNQAAVAVLKTLPGVTEVGARALMRRCETLAGVADLSEAEPTACLGGERAAKALCEFLSAACPVP